MAYKILNVTSQAVTPTPGNFWTYVHSLCDRRLNSVASVFSTNTTSSIAYRH